MNAQILRDVLLFLLANIIGLFFSTGIAYHLAIALNIFIPTDELLTSGALKDHFFGTVPLVGLGCAVLSFGFFFFKGKGRNLILLLPVILPVLYGLSVLIRLSNASA